MLGGLEMNELVDRYVKKLYCDRVFDGYTWNGLEYKPNFRPFSTDKEDVSWNNTPESVKNFWRSSVREVLEDFKKELVDG